MSDSNGVPSLESLTAEVAALNSSMDAGWTILAGVLVFFMQAGFTLLEAGAVRKKNTVAILMKNLIDVGVG